MAEDTNNAEDSCMEDRVADLEHRLQMVTERLHFLKKAVFDLTGEGVKSNLEKLDLCDGDAVIFTVPDELTYDDGFFEGILPIFQEKNVSVIAIHNGIEVKQFHFPMYKNEKLQS